MGLETQVGARGQQLSLAVFLGIWKAAVLSASLGGPWSPYSTSNLVIGIITLTRWSNSFPLKYTCSNFGVTSFKLLVYKTQVLLTTEFRNIPGCPSKQLSVLWCRHISLQSQSQHVFPPCLVQFRNSENIAYELLWVPGDSFVCLQNLSRIMAENFQVKPQESLHKEAVEKVP